MIIDVHTHLGNDARVNDGYVAQCAVFDIEHAWCSCVGVRATVEYPTAEEMRAANDTLLSEMRRYPGFLHGYVYVNPRLDADAVAELERGLDAGMEGMKLLTACRHSDPLVFPLIERCIERRIPVLLHAWRKAEGNEPGHSEPRDVAELARRYPEATLIMAHLGGDWEHGLKVVRPMPNVLVDICMSVIETGQVEMAVRELGAERVLFGSDAPANDVRANIGKLRGAKVDERARRLIESENMLRVMEELKR
jgi:predicted TIM-barrel fold metal-dependent hydrolase